MSDLTLFNQPPEPTLTNKTFFNTTRETGEVLKEMTAAAGKQNQEVLSIMRRLKSATPSQVHRAYGTLTPITSIRRAMTTLTSDGHLVKTDQKVMGPYARPEFIWKLSDNG